MPAAPGKIPSTINLPITLKRRIAVEAAKRGINKGDLISGVLLNYLDTYLDGLDGQASDSGELTDEPRVV